MKLLTTLFILGFAALGTAAVSTPNCCTKCTDACKANCPSTQCCTADKSCPNCAECCKASCCK